MMHHHQGKKGKKIGGFIPGGVGVELASLKIIKEGHGFFSFFGV